MEPGEGSPLPPPVLTLSPCVPHAIWQVGVGEPDEDSCYLQTTHRVDQQHDSSAKAPHKSVWQPGCTIYPAQPAVTSAFLLGHLPSSVRMKPLIMSTRCSQPNCPPHKSKALAGATNDWQPQEEPCVVGRTTAPQVSSS